MTNNYVYAVARLRVREKTLLTDADISQMVVMASADAVLDYLISRGWGSAESGRDPDAILQAEETKNMALMEELGVDKKVFDIFDIPRRYHNVKAAIKEVLTSDTHDRIFYDIPDFGRREVLAIFSEKHFDALPEAMRAPAEQAFEYMVSTRDGQMCDTILDRACLVAMTDAAKKAASPVIQDYIRATVATADIRIAVRAAKIGKPLGFLNTALAPSEAFPVHDLAQEAAKGTEALYPYLQEHGFADAVEALKVSPSSFERWCDNCQIEAIKPQKTNPFTSGPIVAFYLARENEIKTVRIILTAKANGFSEDAIRERVREMYV